MRDVLNFTFTEGYFDTGNYVDVPENVMIYPSSNMVYDKTGRLSSWRGLTSTYSAGGTRAFTIDKDTVAFLGTDVTTNKGIGNVLQGNEKSLWFVGNDVTNGVKVYTLTSSPSTTAIPIGGTRQKETITLASSTSFAQITHPAGVGGTSNTFNAYSLVGHGFVAGQKITFSDAGLGFPAPLNGTTTYYVLSPAANDFQFSTTLGGSPVDITGADTNVAVKSPQFQVVVTSDKVAGSPVTVLVELNPSAETATTVATKVREALRSNAAVSAQFYITSSGAVVTLEDKYIRVNNFNVSIPTNLCGVTTVANSTQVTAGATTTAATLADNPQYCKWNGTGWDNPVPVGLPEFTNAETPALDLTTKATRSTGFDGLVIGSRSVRIARKRYDAISTPTPSSNLVTASEAGDSLTVTIPTYASDGSAKVDNKWILYFTYKGQGSTATHKQFPLEIPEAQLDGSETPAIVQQGNAKYKVLSQSTTTQSSRVVEVEFNDNELLLVEPNIEAFPPDACKFLAKLGNVMCAIGTGDDSTGFDVSLPNEYESYPPDWRDWLAEVPVALAQQSELQYFWISTANTTYVAEWTGVTEDSAPVILKKYSSIYGAIGEAATTCAGNALFALTRGKTPIAVSPDGQVNDEIGARVKNAFVNYDDTTQVSWDEATNTVVFACGTSAIGFQLDTQLWTAPITTGAGDANKIRAMFPLNGNLYVCRFNSTFDSSKWHSGTDTVNWNVTSAFQLGESGRSLKDIIQVEGVISSEVNSGTLTFYAYKDFRVTSPSNLASVTLSSSGAQILVRQYAEDLDYEAVSASISGTKGGQTVHSAVYTVDIHQIERLT